MSQPFEPPFSTSSVTPEIRPWQEIDADRTLPVDSVYPSIAPMQELGPPIDALHPAIAPIQDIHDARAIDALHPSIAPMQEILHVAVPHGEPVGASIDVISASTITPAAPGSRTLDLGSFDEGSTVSFACFGGHPYLQVNKAGPDGVIHDTLEFTPDTNTYGRVGVTIDGVHMDYPLNAIDQGTLGWIYEWPTSARDTDHLIAEVIPYDGTLIPGHLPVLPQPPL